MEPIKLYLLVPHHDVPADGPLVLGTIITDLRDPDSLNEGAVVGIPPENIHTTHKYEWEETIEFDEGANTGVCARYISALLFGGSLSGHSEARSVIQYRFLDLETKYFSPTQEYMEHAVNKRKVRMYLEGSRFAPVYMITGLKIGRGPDSQVTSNKSYNRESNVKTRFTGNSAGSESAVDSRNVTLHQSGAKRITFRGSSDFVIAYRLAKITFQKNADGTLHMKSEKYTAGALLGEELESSRRDEIPLSVSFEGDAAIRYELSEEKETLAMAIDEEDDHECEYFIVPPEEPDSP